MLININENLGMLDATQTNETHHHCQSRQVNLAPLKLKDNAYIWSHSIFSFFLKYDKL